MKLNRVLIVLVTLTLGIQLLVLYNQYYRPGSRNALDPVQVAEDDAFIPLEGIAVRGNRNSGVILVEYSDYECPFCKRHSLLVAPKLEQKYVSTGTIQHAFANNPLPIHPNSRMLASAAICAGQQDKYWQVHDMIFADDPKSRTDIFALAGKAMLDVPKFQDCLGQSSLTDKYIERDIAKAAELRLKGTPAFAIGFVDPDRKGVQVRKVVLGAVPFEILERVIEELVGENRRAAH